MKLWLCVLSALLLAGCTAGTDVPGSVTPTAVPTPAAAETGETAEAAATPAPTADAVQPPQGLAETGAAVLDYDDIRLLRYSRELQPYPEVEYYTMCRDGKWGLMRSDGSEVLALPARRSRCLNVVSATAIGTTTQAVFRGRPPTRCERNMPVSCRPAAMV